MAFEPNKENLTTDTATKKVFQYCNEHGQPIYKTKEILPNQRIIFYPFTVNRTLGQVRPKKIKVIEFRGWNDVVSLPKVIRKTPNYGFKFESSTQFLNVLYKRFPQLQKVIIVLNGNSKFASKTISLSWTDFSNFIKKLKKEKGLYEENRKHVVHKILSEKTDKVAKIPRTLKSGELEDFLGQFDSYDKISVKDIDALTAVLSDLPTTKITSTSHVVKTKEKMDVIYLEDIINQYQSLLKNSPTEEEKWQQFFQSHTWTLTHLFPYEVILSKGKAYVGGKTFENDEGRIVDFLFETGFKDNFALLEIKTPDTPLMKKTPYREPAVYSLSDDLSGSINQCLDQKDIFMRDLGQKQKSLDPKTILVVGQKKKLSSTQKDCFELCRANQKNVDVVTFDELEAKLLTLYEVITGKRRKL